MTKDKDRAQQISSAGSPINPAPGALGVMRDKMKAKV
jgi:hypothetical protein